MRRNLTKATLALALVLGCTHTLMAFGLQGLTDGLKKLDKLPIKSKSKSESSEAPPPQNDAEAQKKIAAKANEDMLLKNQMPFGENECLIEYIEPPLHPLQMEEKKAVLIGDIKVMGDSAEIRDSALEDVRKELIRQLEKGGTFSKVIDKNNSSGELGEDIYYITGSLWSKYDIKRKTTYKRDTNSGLHGQKDIIVPINFQIIKCFLKVNLSLKQIVRAENTESVEVNIASVSDTASFRFKLQGSRKINTKNFFNPNRDVQSENTDSFVDESLLADFELGKWAVKKFLRQFSSTPELVKAQIGGTDANIKKLIHESKPESFKKALALLEGKAQKTVSDLYNIALCKEGLQDYKGAAELYSNVIGKSPNNNAYLAGWIRVGTRL